MSYDDGDDDTAEIPGLRAKRRTGTILLACGAAGRADRLRRDLQPGRGHRQRQKADSASYKINTPAGGVLPNAQGVDNVKALMQSRCANS